MSEPVLSRKRQGAQDAVDTLETFEAFEAFEAFDKHGLPAFVRGVDAEALYFFLALFRTGTLPRAAEQLGISLSSANRMLAKLRTYWDDPLFVRSGFLMQPTTAAKRRYDKVLSLMHGLRICGATTNWIQELFRAPFARPATTMHLRSALPRFLLTSRPACRMCGCAPCRPMNISLIICVKICSIWCSLPGRDIHPDVHSVALLTTPYVCLVRRGHPLSERAAALGPLEREDLEAFPQVLINAQPDRYRAPNSPGNGWFNPKNPDCIALVTPFFLAASLCLEETDCYAIVPKATAELALEAMLQLSDAAPKLTVRLGWHERTHADPGSQLIRAQLLALIQKRFGRPVGE